MSQTMKAVVYKKPFEVTIEEVEIPKILSPNDVIVKVTTSAICGSDLHMYEGRTAAEPGIVFGHENQGIITEIGSGISLLKVGDRVVMPFNVGCGRCLNCEQGKTAFCTVVNPPFSGGAYGYVSMGPYSDMSFHLAFRSQQIRVPFADFNCLVLPPGKEFEADFILLADIFPTGWHGVELSGFQPGETIAIFGGGPVGIMACYSAYLRGASKIYCVDRVPERLAKAASFGCIPIDFSKGDPVDQIIAHNGGMVDRSVDAVGYQATVAVGKLEVPNVILTNLIRVTRPCGGLGIIGLYVPSDPGAPTKAAAEGNLMLPFGKLFEKGLQLATGQCNVKKYNRYLRDLIISGRAKPSFVVSHECGIDGAPEAYQKFDDRVDGYTKVLLHPNGTNW